MTNYVKCATVLKTRGLKGELKVKSFSSFDRFKKGATIYFLEDGNYVPYKIYSSYLSNGFYYITLKDLFDINLVLGFVGHDIYIVQDRCNDLDVDEYYYSDLIGKDVKYKDKVVGKCTDILELGQGSILKFLINDKEILIPFRKEFIGDISDFIYVIDSWGLF